MSKMLKITMIIVMTFFTIILTPHERASANPLAVGGALYLGGAGIYVVGTLGVAAVAGLIELDSCTSCQDDLEAHAFRTWATATDNAKTGLQYMVDSAVGVGNTLTATDANFNTWMDSQLKQITANAFSSAYGIMGGDGTYAYTKTSSAINYKSMIVGQTFLVDGKVSSSLDISFNDSFSRLGVSYQGSGLGTVYFFPGTARYQQLKSMLASITNIEQAISLIVATGTVGFISAMADATNYERAYGNVNEAWQDMKDAGLVLPVDGARLVNEYGPVTYDPATDSYAGIDGVNVAREDITAEYPNVRYKTQQDLINAGAAAGASAGLYIDGWTSTDSTTSTYDPATDVTTSTTSSTTTSTNVTTGETVTSTTSTTSTSTGDTTGDTTSTPEGGTPKTQTGKANRWGKLVTTKFPFSLPWDLFFILSFLNAEPKTPVFSIDERINKRPNVEGIAIKFDIDLSFLDPYVPWFRRFIVLGFALFLILNTRKLLGGAQ